MTKQTRLNRSIRAWMDVFLHRSMRGWWRFARSTGLSMPQFSMMMQMYHYGACGMSEVSERFEITPAAASQLADKLVQSGLIMRQENPNDRRAKLLDLTQKGRELIEQGIEERYRWVAEMEARLTDEQRTQISEALDLMTRIGQDLEVDPVH
ncbi:MAG: MarR family transcriptional regulator [Chloroflexi bacterium]|nr:MarR family transcriptional regulator [Chloroflexota bacterium]